MQAQCIHVSSLDEVRSFWGCLWRVQEVRSHLIYSFKCTGCRATESLCEAFENKEASTRAQGVSIGWGIAWSMEPFLHSKLHEQRYITMNTEKVNTTREAPLSLTYMPGFSTFWNQKKEVKRPLKLSETAGGTQPYELVNQINELSGTRQCSQPFTSSDLMFISKYIGLKSQRSIVEALQLSSNREHLC